MAWSQAPPGMAAAATARWVWVDLGEPRVEHDEMAGDSGVVNSCWL